MNRNFGMRLHSVSWRLALLIGAWAAAAHAAVSDGARVAAPTAVVRSFAAVDSAVEDLKRDPNLGGESKVRTLKWTQASEPAPPQDPSPWIVGFFNYLGQLSSLLLWVAGAVAVAVAAVWVFRHIGAQQRRQSSDTTPGTMGRVLDLDIRPNSLPDDVGAAALGLSRAGRLREALSLLYRASLSRAINRFGVTIGPSLTEREVLGAVSASFDESRARYFADLVMMRQRVVYAGEGAAHEEVAALCARFSDTLDERPI